MRLKGFNNDWFGIFMILYTGVASVGWIIYLLVISLDYYGYVLENTPYILTYNSYDLSSKALCLFWFLSTSWYLILNLCRDKVINFFRLRQSLDKATYIQVETPRQVIQMLQKGNTNNDTPFSILSKLQSLEIRLRTTLGFDVFVDTLKINTSVENNRRYFEFQSTRYIYHEGTFLPASIQLGSNVTELLSMAHGLSTKEALKRLEVIGPNFIAVNVPSFIGALWQELTGFFYIYQLQILWVYFYMAYWQIGVSDTGVILLSAIIKVILRLRSEYRVKSMAEHVNEIQALRDDKWQTISTADLVPGDVFRITPNQVVPVDAVILEGDVVVDESSLTGEPLPIRKVPLRDDGLSYDRLVSGKIHSLYAGTTIKQASSSSIGLVLETRTNTEKGQLVKKILYPQPVSFIFHEQLKLVFCILLCWAVVLLGIGSWWLGGRGMTALFYGLTCAAQVMNPLLPAILVVGQSIASGRLRQKGIFCVDLPRILMAGKVQVFCFDKTGTLTKEGLEYYGVYPVKQTSTTVQFEGVKHHFKDLNEDDQQQQLLRWGMTSCHSVTILDDKFIGNPVDIVMFQSTGANMSTVDGTDIFTLSSNGNENRRNTTEQLEIIQRFEFQHARASMSVAVRNTITGHIHIFCKGSFEKIQHVCSQVPNDYVPVTSNLAREGCYVLGMAHRDLDQIDPDIVRGWSRDELESNLSFLGLVLFKNLLKEDTKDAITQLKEGDTRTVMVTGDNALTGVFIGQQCGLVPPHVRVLVGDMISSTSTGDTSDIKDEFYKDDDDEINEKNKLGLSMVVWHDAETGEREYDVDLALQTQNVELAVTGKAFQHLLATDQMRHYLFSTRIFARMTPLDKMQCVKLFMERAVTAMCGDGGNDCGALRTAHVGIAMSEAEASVVSPFSTPKRSVQACVDLLIQGRAGLATSFASYKYLIMYGETFATIKFLTFYYTMSFSQWNFILIDAFITVFCAFAVTQAGSAIKLSKHRPTARILGPEVLFSVLGQLFINAWFLIGAYIWLYTRDDFFRCHEWDARATDSSKWWLLGDSFEADILTFITLYQFVNAGFVFNYGYIFRKSWYRNYLLICIWALFVAIVSYWELADPNSFGCLMRLNCGDPDVLVALGYPRPDYAIEPYNNPWGHNVLPRSFRYQLWAYSIGNFLVVNAWELLVVLGPIRNYLRSRYPLKRLQIPL
ncbi:uncharacterized protein BX664DRAFT_333638 [Halteromyces radiatus]|uniref:uncharacterized protein n=1 Tax=Halteromyces radiatus TaxID=101107 RepID=UPI00221EAC61|nr:uncharacterized protein BX664DRAFT_333638 [Halteromyces radiatus]KAI8089682.1 hypothetical protein BX664DRAFT_333638 [Halteromyces radiatus]